MAALPSLASRARSRLLLRGRVGAGGMASALAGTRSVGGGAKSFDSAHVDVEGTTEYVDELLAPASSRVPSDASDAERLRRSKLTSTRGEALTLYRNVLRATRLFEWRDDAGRPWREVLRESARKEFEAARHEREPEMVARLLLGGRDCLNQTMQKFAVKQDSLMRGGQPADAGAGSSGAPGGGSGTGWPGAQG